MRGSKLAVGGDPGEVIAESGGLMPSKLESVTRRLVVLATVTSFCGCSFVLTRGPAKSDPTPQPGVAMAPPDCTTSMSWPAVDGIFAGLMILGVAAAADENNTNEFDNDR